MSGLRPGDKIITQGTANLQNGAPVRPVPANAPLRIAPPSKEQQQQQGGGAAQGKAG
jgi:membrane fusion protein (multidrug efflux system)